MTSDQRKRRIEQINKIADKLDRVSRGYGSLRYQCEKSNVSDAMLDLTYSAGAMADDRLRQLGDLLDCLWQAGVAMEEPSE